MPFRRIWIALLCFIGGSASGGCSVDQTGAIDGPVRPPTTTVDVLVTDRDRIEGGVQLCPVLTDFSSRVADVFNRTADDVGELTVAEDRRDRWLLALEQMRSADSDLAAALDSIDAIVLVDVIADVRAGIVVSERTIDEIEDFILETPVVDELRHQQRTQQVIVRVEKVIDAVKPSMASYGDDRLIELWRDLPGCQFGVKDVDDGKPRSGG